MQEAINFFNMNNFNGVIHLAALVQSQKHSSQDIDRLLDTNIKFATKVLEISVSANVQWFINTGTFWQNFQNAEYSPVNLYAATKQAFEIIAKYI
jgi:nucleoside-diphosphate-sugar epimerase